MAAGCIRGREDISDIQSQLLPLGPQNQPTFGAALKKENQNI